MRWIASIVAAVLILGSVPAAPAWAQSRSAERGVSAGDRRVESRLLVRTVERSSARRVIDAPALVGRRVSEARHERVMPTQRAARATYDSDARRSRFELPAYRGEDRLSRPSAASGRDAPSVAELRNRIALLEQRLADTRRDGDDARRADRDPHAGYDPGPDPRQDFRPVVMPYRSGAAHVVLSDGRVYHPVPADRHRPSRPPYVGFIPTEFEAVRTLDALHQEDLDAWPAGWSRLGHGYRPPLRFYVGYIPTRLSARVRFADLRGYHGYRPPVRPPYYRHGYHPSGHHRYLIVRPGYGHPRYGLHHRFGFGYAGHFGRYHGSHAGVTVSFRF